MCPTGPPVAVRTNAGNAGSPSLIAVPASPSRLPWFCSAARSRACGCSATVRTKAKLRWSRFFGQVVKLGSPDEKDGPDDGQAEAVWR